MCAIGKDSMTASRLCELMLFAGSRKAPTHRDGSKSASRWVGVPTSAARLRRCPIRIADSDPSGLLGALLHSILKTWPRDFLSPEQTYRSCQRKREGVGPLCLEPRGSIWVCRQRRRRGRFSDLSPSNDSRLHISHKNVQLGVRKSSGVLGKVEAAEKQ